MSNDDALRDAGVVPGRDGPGERREQLVRWFVFLGYIAVVVFTAAHHEMWRDEVRALSLAHEGTLKDLFGELRYEGHPAVWYLLLRAGYAVTASRMVLPGLSLVVAVAAAYLILRFAPFSWPQKILLLLGVFPLFEYSVVARNYGIGMLLVVVLAMQYPGRLERPVWWGVLLALLANTSAHAAVIAVAILLGTGWDFVVAWRTGVPVPLRRLNARRIWLGAAIAIAGLVAARATVSTNRLPDWPGPMPGVRTVAHQMALSALNPGHDLAALVPSPVTELGDSHTRLPHSTAQAIAIDAVLILMVAGLWGEWSLLLIVVVAVLGTGALFRTVYGAHMRHLGLVWFLLVMVYWEMVRRQGVGGGAVASPRRRIWWTLAAPLTAVMVLQAIEGIRRVRQDVTQVWSSGMAVAELLRAPEYRSAIVMATRDYWLETVAYYSPNRLYFHNQRRFESHVNLTLPFFGDRTISGLLAIADTVATTTRSPIVLLVSDSDIVRESSTDALALRRRTLEVAALDHVIGDESYRVLRLRSPGDTSGSRRIY